MSAPECPILKRAIDSATGGQLCKLVGHEVAGGAQAGLLEKAHRDWNTMAQFAGGKGHKRGYGSVPHAKTVTVYFFWAPAEIAWWFFFVCMKPASVAIYKKLAKRTDTRTDRPSLESGEGNPTGETP